MKLVFHIFFVLVSCCPSCLAQGDWVWAKRGDLNGASAGLSTATDKDGNVFVTGYYHSPTLTFESITLVNAGYVNIFIVKYDSLGNVLWAKTFGSTFSDQSHGIATDLEGNVFITGHFSSSSITFGNTTLQGSDINTNYSTAEFFIAKLDLNGNVLWAKSAKGIRWDEGDGIAIDARGNVYVSGNSDGSLVFDNAVSLNGTGYFLAKYNMDGEIVWARVLEPSLSETFGRNSIAIDQTGNIYFGGGMVIPLLIDNVQHITTQAFLSKFNSNGDLLWEKKFEGDGPFPYSFSSGVTTDASGKVYVTGAYHQGISFNGTRLFSPGSLGNLSSIFIAKFDEDGNTLWVRSATRGRGIAYDIAADNSGSLFIAGSLELFGPNKDTLNFEDIYLKSAMKEAGGDHIFVAQYDTAGTALSAYLVESETPNDGLDVSTDSYGNAFVTGMLDSDLNSPYRPEMGPIRFGDVEVLHSTEGSMYIAKLKACHPVVSRIKSSSFCFGDSVTLSSPFVEKNKWSTGDTSQSISVKLPGVYSLQVFSSSGCKILSEVVNVTVNPLPKAEISSSGLVFCKGEVVTLTSNSETDNLWSTGETSSSISIGVPGTYTIITTDSNNCSTTSAAIELKQYPPLQDITLLQDCNKIFLRSDNPVTWFMNEENMNWIKPDQKEIYPQDSGHYYVEIKNQCETKRSNTIKFEPYNLSYIFQPNVITPNGDKYNDFFVLDSQLIGSTVEIVNRWGNEVFHSENYQNDWNGDDLPPGTYFYIIKNDVCITEEIKGTLTIVR